VRAEREVERDTARVRGQERDDAAPQVGVDQRAVDEDDRGALTVVEDPERALREREVAGGAMEEVVAAAGVTRGALYHHFRDKRDLFRAVYERSERDIVAGIAAEAHGLDDPWAALVAGVRSYLEACTDPRLVRIVLIDAPAVLGWREWRAIGHEHALGMTSAALGGAMEAGVLRRADVEPLAHLLMAALSEAGMLVADADDPWAARETVERAVVGLLEGLRG
jgi:AcrR family transcriptional regulator